MNIFRVEPCARGVSVAADEGVEAPKYTEEEQGELPFLGRRVQRKTGRIAGHARGARFAETDDAREIPLGEVEALRRTKGGLREHGPRPRPNRLRGGYFGGCKALGGSHGLLS